MARKTIRYDKAQERDKGKTYLITEMGATQGEAWALKVLLALLKSNVQVPEGFLDLGMAALAEMGLRMVMGGIEYERLAPLLEEMMGCVQIMTDVKIAFVRHLIEDDIEEIATRLALRVEIWNLHMGFLKGVLPFLDAKETVRPVEG